MKALDFDVGDKAWIYGAQVPTLKFKLFPWPRFVPSITGPNGLSEGKVVLEFQRQGVKYYVIEIPTHIEPVLFVRDGLTMSDSAKKPIGMFRNISP